MPVTRILPKLVAIELGMLAAKTQKEYSHGIGIGKGFPDLFFLKDFRAYSLLIASEVLCMECFLL